MDSDDDYASENEEFSTDKDFEGGQWIGGEFYFRSHSLIITSAFHLTILHWNSFPGHKNGVEHKLKMNNFMAVSPITTEIPAKTNSRKNVIERGRQKQV